MSAGAAAHPAPAAQPDLLGDLLDLDVASRPSASAVAAPGPVGNGGCAVLASGGRFLLVPCPVQCTLANNSFLLCFATGVAASECMTDLTGLQSSAIHVQAWGRGQVFTRIAHSAFTVGMESWGSSRGMGGEDEGW